MEKGFYDEFKEEYYSEFKLALRNGFTPQVICSIDTVQRNEELIRELITEYPGKIKFYVMEKPPERHASLIGRDLFLEVPHEPGVPYESALGIENPRKEIREHFNQTFEKYKSQAVQVISTSGDIDTILKKYSI